MKKTVTLALFLFSVLLANAQTYVLTKRQDFGFGSIFDMKNGTVMTGNPGSGYANVLENGQTKVFNPSTYSYQKDLYGKWNAVGKFDNHYGNSFATNGQTYVLSTDRIFENWDGCIAYTSGQCLNIKIYDTYPYSVYTALKGAKVAIGDSVLLTAYHNQYYRDSEFLYPDVLSVKLYRQNTEGTWVLDRTMSPDCLTAMASLSIDKKYAVIGQPQCGSIYISCLSNHLKDTLIRNPAPGAVWGSLVKTMGNEIVVNGLGGPEYNIKMLYVLESNEVGDWSVKQTLTSPNLNPDEGFDSFSMDGHRLIAGAPRYNGGKGAVYVYAKGLDGLYALSQTIVNDTLDAQGSFGRNVGISGPSIAVTSVQSLFFFQIPSPEIRLKRGSETIPSGAANQYFGDQSVGTLSDPMTFTIVNGGQDTLLLTGTPKISLSGANANEFTVNTSGLASKIPPNGHSNFTVTFAPTSLGVQKYSRKEAIVSFSTNDYEESMYTFGVNGYTMIGPDVKVKQGATTILYNSTYDFGSVALGHSSSSIAFAIRNMGTDTLWLVDNPRISIYNATDFEIYQAGVAPYVLPGAYTTFTIRFRPQSAGTIKANIVIKSNDFDEGEFVFYVTGNGLSSANQREDEANPISSSFSESVNAVPNPAHDKVVVSLSNHTTATVTVRDMLGKVLLEKSGENEIILDVAHVESGILFLEVVQGQNRTVKRVVKN
jgi:hypothetical protein